MMLSITDEWDITVSTQIKDSRFTTSRNDRCFFGKEITDVVDEYNF